MASFGFALLFQKLVIQSLFQDRKKESSSSVEFMDLPPEVLSHIINSYLPNQTQSKVRISQVCHALRHLVSWKGHHLKISVDGSTIWINDLRLPMRKWPDLVQFLLKQESLSISELSLHFGGALDIGRELGIALSLHEISEALAESSRKIDLRSLIVQTYLGRLQRASRQALLDSIGALLTSIELCPQSFRKLQVLHLLNDNTSENFLKLLKDKPIKQLCLGSQASNGTDLGALCSGLKRGVLTHLDLHYSFDLGSLTTFLETVGAEVLGTVSVACFTIRGTFEQLNHEIMPLLRASLPALKECRFLFYCSEEIQDVHQLFQTCCDLCATLSQQTVFYGVFTINSGLQFCLGPALLHRLQAIQPRMVQFNTDFPYLVYRQANERGQVDSKNFTQYNIARKPCGNLQCEICVRSAFLLLDGLDALKEECSGEEVDQENNPLDVTSYFAIQPCDLRFVRSFFEELKPEVICGLQGNEGKIVLNVEAHWFNGDVTSFNVPLVKCPDPTCLLCDSLT